MSISASSIAELWSPVKDIPSFGSGGAGLAPVECASDGHQNKAGAGCSPDCARIMVTAFFRELRCSWSETAGQSFMLEF